MKVFLLLIAVFAGQTWGSPWKEYRSIGVFQAFVIEGLADISDCNKPQRSVIRDETDKAVQCVKNIRSNNSFCDTFTNHFKPCLDNVLIQVKDCEGPSEHGMKKILLDSLIVEAKYICNTDGEHILELLNPCVKRSLDQSGPCLKNVTLATENFMNEAAEKANDEPGMDVIGKSCGDMVDGTKKCFYKNFNTECPNQVTRDAIQQFLDVKVEPCNFLVPYFVSFMTFSM